MKHVIYITYYIHLLWNTLFLLVFWLGLMKLAARRTLIPHICFFHTLLLKAHKMKAILLQIYVVL
jgi:spore maturation protein SpmA